MRRRNIVLLLLLIMSAVAGGFYIMLNSSFESDSAINEMDKEKSSEVCSTNVKTSDDDGIAEVEQIRDFSYTHHSIPAIDTDQQALELVTDENSTKIVKSENIDVIGNSLEYDLKAATYENEAGNILIKLEYYLDGVGTVEELSQEQLPEIKDMFIKREGQASKKGYRIKQLYLHAKKAKVYLIIEGKDFGDEVETSIYSYTLGSGKPERLFNTRGNFSGPLFNRDMSYMAFSCIITENNEEASLLQIVECETDEFIVNSNRTAKDTPVGKKTEDGRKQDYLLVSWHTGKIVRLNLIIRSQGQHKIREGLSEAKEVLYDFTQDIFYDLDGKPLNDSDDNENSLQKSESENIQKEQTTLKEESECIKALKEFYSYMSSQNEYQKAYDMLDENFVMQMNLLKQFGIAELRKQDMDIYSFPLYAHLFKSARIESIVSEEMLDDSLTIIYFFQTFASEGSNEEIRMPVVFRMKKFETDWKILQITDGSLSDKPFSDLVTKED